MLEARPKAARVALPAEATAPAHIADVASNVSVDVALLDARDVAAQTVDGYAVYPKAYRSGATVIERELPEGAEDYLSFETRPATPQVDYQVGLGDEVAGLRLVANTLEMVDEDGAPRLRVEPPYIVGADGVRTEATLAVEGCAMDDDASGPWRRGIADPGARTCTLHVRWPDENVVYPAVLDPRWTTTGSMTTSRQGHTATLLSTGKVLVAGGTSNGATALASAELYDRTTGTWAATGSMTGARTLHTATQLNTSSNSTTSGKVLVAGGLNGSTSQNTAQLYSPSTGTWTAAANLNAARHGQTATLLASGKVLLAGGLNGTAVLNTAALYDPSSGAGSWTATGNMPQAVKFHTATLLTVPSNGTLNDKVLVVGGNSGGGSVSNVQLFDGTSAWSSLTALPGTREGHTATALANGNVLIAGGKSGSTTLNTTLLFNAAAGSGSWSSAGTLTGARQLHAAVLLPSGLVANGQVLLVGGNNGSSTLASTDLWNGSTTWTATTALPTPVQGETATLLSNNLVLVAGGVNGSTTVATADLYDASFSLSCTSDSQCATGFCVSGVCCDTACNGGCGVCNLPGKVGTCSAASSGTICRAASGACDVAETCNGTSLACPTDAVAPLGSVCRSAAGACDVPETCDGSTKACPVDTFAPATTVCRASTGTCDAAETCTGTSAACPADAFAPATTICRRAAGGCDVAETCTGTSSLCPPDVLAAAGTVCRPAESLCDVAETCSGSSSVCPTDTFAAAGTTCGAAAGSSPAPVCSGSNGCPVASGTSDVLGFEAASDWAFDPSATASIIGLNASRTQGAGSLEVTAQNYARLNSVPLSSVGGIGSIVLLDIQLPTDQANPTWYGDAQMYVNSPSLGINNVFLSDVPLTGLALGTWQTLAFPMPAATAATIAGGVYSDLTFSVVLNVPYNETGHYLLDNIRSIPDVVPSLLGIAQDGATLKAVFDYVTTSSTPVAIPYGTANGLTNQSGFMASPPEAPPTTFVSTTHAPFVATLSSSLLTWTVGSHSVTATPSSQQLTVTTLGDGTHDATLPDGRRVNLDSVPPPNPSPASEPVVGSVFNGVLTGQFGVSPNGASTYTVPIDVPPGVAGMAPNLSLVYNSQSADGIAGQGWQLSGLSIVHRCPRTRQEDGAAQPVTMLQPPAITDQDVSLHGDGICLDGERLFEQGSGKYLAEKTDFSQITYFADDHFEVITKAGETRYYGLTSKSRVVAQGIADDGVTKVSGTAIWALERVMDPWGNYFDIHYNEDNADFTLTGVRVSSISYTGHMNGSGTIDTQPFNTITFDYDPPPSAGVNATRPDVRWTRFGTTLIPRNRRLQSITTPRGTYTLTYFSADPSRASTLSMIGYCTGSTCLQPLSFVWTPESSGWPEKPEYELPADLAVGKGLSGVQMIDLNGDGRLDLVFGRTNGTGGKSHPQTGSYLNTGSGWGPALTGKDRTLPVYLADENDQPTTARFADLDGDGQVDIIVDNANVACDDVNGCISCPVDQGCSGMQNYGPAVWLNRFNLDGSGGWEFHPEYSGLPSGNYGIPFPVSFKSPGHIVTVSDIDGNGKADIVGVTTIRGETQLDVFLNQGPNQPVSWVGFTQSGISAGGNPQLRDVNRDGLPDLVTDFYYTLSDGTLSAIETTALNQGLGVNDSSIQFSAPVTHGAAPNGGQTAILRGPQNGDIDGDGLYDTVEYYSTFGTGGVTDPTAYVAYAAMGDGISLGVDDPFAQTYLGTIKAMSPVVNEAGEQVYTEDFAYALADINGDGLVDLIRNHLNRSPAISIYPNRGGGEILYNTGTNWSAMSAQFNTWQVPAGPDAIPGVVPSDVTAGCGSVFLDADGDGAVDLIQEETCTGGRFGRSTWLNMSKPPVISQFPNGLNRPTVVSYVSTTELAAHTDGVPCDGVQPNAVYCDDDAVDPGTKRMASPVRVVSKVTAIDGTGAYQDTGYAYHSLRTDPNGRGPQGFHHVIAYDHASGVATSTTYSQAYPYTGMPTKVERFQVLPSGTVPLTSTATDYCDSVDLDASGVPLCSQPGASYPPRTSVFVYASEVTDKTFTHPETGDTADYVQITSDFRYDRFGNAASTTVNSQLFEAGSDTQSVTKQTVNQYGTPGSPEETQGKVTLMTETNTCVSVGPFDCTPKPPHHTALSYSPVSSFGGASQTALALLKKQVEPGLGWPIELDTAYAYDQFGNVILTTSCANDFDGCTAGAPGPVGSSDPVHHPPYRTSSVSYSPSDFNVPSGSGLISGLTYGLGRFPVKTTNPAGHVEYTAYDPIKGAVIQKTGPNGISTCYSYDDLGRQTSETARCGSAQPLETTMQYAFVGSVNLGAPPGTPPNSRTVTVVRPASGPTTWTYLDSEGKTTGTLKRAFDGGFIGTLISYNALRKVTQASKPFLLPTLTAQSSPNFTTTIYDSFNRVQQVYDDLGAIDGSNSPKTELVTTIYNGPTVETDRTVNGQTQKRVEIRTATGKVASVVDGADAMAMGVNYKFDVDGNVIQTTAAGGAVVTSYDVRGRKLGTSDPDLGGWSYTFDGFGDLVSQTDAKGQQLTMTYDVLGRIVTKTNGVTGETAQWIYDTAPGAGVGKLAAMVSEPDPKLAGPCSLPAGASVTGGNRAVKAYAYTPFGDLQGVSECADGDAFQTSYEYDSLGRQSLVRYPAVQSSQLAVGYHYTHTGYLQYLTDESTDYSILWQAKSMNALGQVTDEQTRNGVETIASRNPSTGWLLGSTSTAHADGDTIIQSWSYGFDEVGNLLARSRTDEVNDAPSSETFTYDGLNRLATAQVTVGSSTTTTTYGYDPLTANLTLKDGKAYSYVGCGAGGRTAGPHAVCSVGGGPTYVYDDNGSMTDNGSRSVTYNAHHKVTEIVSDPIPSQGNDTGTVDFMYGADENRVVQVVTSGGSTSRTVYVGLAGTGKSMYERTTTGSSVQHVNFIYAGSAHGGNAFAIRTLDTNGSVSGDSYFSFDHLGSTTAVSDQKGHIAVTTGSNAGLLGYDPWGARRNPDGTTASPTSFAPIAGHREFTGQESIPDVGLINMNGRVYDPVLGRFLSADPTVPDLTDAQSYNRYSYVVNNPLRYTDPTGFSFWGDLGSFFENPANDFFLLGSIVACASTAVGCLAWGVMQTAINVASAADAGASFQQTAVSIGVGVGFGFLTMGTVSALGGGGLASIIAGSASAAAATAFTDAVSNHTPGWDVLVSAFTNAASGAITYGLQQAAMVSAASAAAAQGGGGSGADYAEKLDTLLAANTSGRSSSDMGAELAYDLDMEKAAATASGPQATLVMDDPLSAYQRFIGNCAQNGGCNSVGSFPMTYGPDAYHNGTMTRAAVVGVGAVGAGVAVDFAAGAILGSPAVAGTVGGTAAAAGANVDDKLILVSRWGREGLQAGDWVMKGNANVWNYLMSGKWQPGLGNEFAAFSSGQTFQVPPSALQIPHEFVLTDWFKALLGQRMYLP